MCLICNHSFHEYGTTAARYDSAAVTSADHGVTSRYGDARSEQRAWIRRRLKNGDNMKRFGQGLFGRCLATALLLAAASFAHGASITYTLDQTNLDPLLPDGQSYLQVTISDAAFGSDADAIRFDVTVLSALTNLADNRFGIQSFAFNTSAGGTVAAISGLPAGWSVDANRTVSGFGEFDFRVSGAGNNRLTPTLTFYVSGISGDAPLDYALVSTGMASHGNGFFAAHVAGFTDLDPSTGRVTSGYFGGGATTVVPLPASAWLFGTALGAFGWLRRRRQPLAG